MRYLVGTIFSALACASGFQGQRLLRKAYTRASQWPATYGQVIGAETVQGPDLDIGHFPIVEFHCPDGRKYTFRSSIGTSVCWGGPGKKVKIVYNPEEPTEAAFYWDMWLWPIAFLIVAALFLLLSLLTFAGLTLD